MPTRIAGLLSLIFLLLHSVAWAQDDSPAQSSAPAAPAEGVSKRQSLGDLDLRAHLQADILLAFITVGVAADFGVLPLGPGTLAVGGEMEVAFCGTFCLAFGALTDTSLSNTYYAPHARVTYHFTPPSKNRRQLEKVDLYGLAFGGMTYTRTHFSGSGWDYKGNDIGPSFGIGAGAKFFLNDIFFFGGEARLRYSTGTYRYTVQVGTVSDTGNYSDWSLSGLNLTFFAGARI